MNAIITSTIIPNLQNYYDVKKIAFNPEERILQTINTIDSLLKNGVKKILLVDNSHAKISEEYISLLNPAIVTQIKHPIFQNRGISELWMLLSMVEQVPDDEALIKISGRYYLDDNSIYAGLNRQEYDIVGSVSKQSKISQLSTRSYYVKNGMIAKELWKRTLSEMYGYQSYVVGIRSMIRIFKNSILKMYDNYDYADPRVGIEHAIFAAAKKMNLKIHSPSNVGLRGAIGADRNNIISE